jgi:hypothetical protein
MDETTEKNQAIKEIAKLARDAELAIDFDFQKAGMNKDEIYTAMAKNVFEQLDNLPENQRAAVAMASMSKLLVENFCLGYTLKQELDKQTNE